MALWLREALIHGGALSAFMTGVIVLSLLQNPKIWVSDAPPAIQAQVGQIDKQTKRQKSAWGIVAFVGLTVIFGRLAARIVEHDGNGYPFGQIFAATLVCFELFNLFDALVIDIGLTIFQPRWAMIPGVDMTALRNPRWHIGAFLKGVFIGIPFAGVVAGLGWVVHAIVAH